MLSEDGAVVEVWPWMVILVEAEGTGSVLRVDVLESVSECDETFDSTEETIDKSTRLFIDQHEPAGANSR